ncbi:hypothetical protein SFA35_13665 [Pseudomonas sp. HR96]|uniref:hypothetical protein n=1 Tax=Pseudomonas sp. HR96 TaxID=1027966 RepID=UPI002A764BB5|nr:hypothetical protein [Pseudomonas sp. HR96]WPO97709.1 hypothetical protein SFA35_13665 [Pseudomonas sp. HR96]
MQQPEMTLPISAEDEACVRMQRAYVDVAAQIRHQAATAGIPVNAAVIGPDVYCISELTDDLLIFPVHDLETGQLRDLHLPQHIEGLSHDDVVEYTQLALAWLQAPVTLSVPQALVDEQYRLMLDECAAEAA